MIGSNARPTVGASALADLVGNADPASSPRPPTSARPKIVMSKTVVDFEDRVVPRDPSRRVPFSDEVTFTNHHLAGLTWSLDDACLRAAAEDAGAEVGASPIFFISPKGGDLAPGDSVTLRVTFSPAESQDYEYKLPLYLEGEKTRPYLTLTLRGCGVFPRLSFDVDETTLPTVPAPRRARKRAHGLAAVVAALVQQFHLAALLGVRVAAQGPSHSLCFSGSCELADQVGSMDATLMGNATCEVGSGILGGGDGGYADLAAVGSGSMSFAVWARWTR